MKLGAAGLPLIIYNRDHGGAVRAQHCGDAVCSSMTAANISDQTLPSHDAGRFIDLTMAHDGRPLAVWAGPYIHDVFCSTPSCSSSSTAIIHQAKGAYPSVAIGDDGLPRVAYYLETGALQLARCANAHCMSPIAPAALTVLATGKGVGKYPSLAICQCGVPCVAFQDSTVGHLLFVICDDRACSSAQPPVRSNALLQPELRRWLRPPTVS